MGRRRTQPPGASRRCRGDRGAALVEFAIVAPLFLLLLFGIIEFGVLFGQELDVRNGAREAARLAAVNYHDSPTSTGSAQTSELVAETCSRMELAADSNVSVSFPGGVAIGDSVIVRVRLPAQPVTGFFDDMLSDTVLSSDVEIRLEQVATYAPVTNEACP